ncbi:MAG: hypothetical protein F6K31_33780 [Symploca sp. SIO2G7]|nr:hypothetical protein [Symploca sp. SIO2G7]
MSNIPQSWLYYALGFVLAFLGAMIAGAMLTWGFVIPGLIVGSLFGIIAYFLYFFGNKLGANDINTHPPNNLTDSNNRNITTGGGVYNEQIQGDSINIQGNQIYLGQDFSEVASQIQEILNELQNQGDDSVSAEEKVINDLKIQIRRNYRIKRKFLKWRKTLGLSNSKPFNSIELAERVVRFARENSSNFYEDSILTIEDKYQKLHDFLKNGRWKEADKETVKLIYRLMPEDHTYIDVDQIPPKDLKKINKLWVKFSNGRFGFSVQQKIWTKILKVYHSSENRYWIDNSVYEYFIDSVGWSREGDRIYHTDIEYSIKAPRGHLPAILMFEYYYDRFDHSNYCAFKKCIFKDLMERQYYNNILIPSWLKKWLPIEFS